MALVVGENSYVSIAEAEAYFEDRVNADEWFDDFTDVQREQSLVTSTGVLDDMRWSGYAVEEAQDLAFPRVVTYFDPRVGRSISIDNIVPQRVKTAQIELAFHLLQNEDVLNNAPSVESLAVGTITLTDLRGASVIPARIRRIVAPLLMNSSNAVYVGS